MTSWLGDDSPLQAVKNDDVLKVAILLRDIPSQEQHANMYVHTLLHLAIGMGKPKIVEMLST